MIMDGNTQHSGELTAQRRFIGEENPVRYRDHLTSAMIDFMESQPFFFISTADDQGHCECSFRGRDNKPPHDPDPLLKVLDQQTLVFPDYAGNGYFNSLGNILVNPHIGMLFVDFTQTRRLRVNGRARIIEDRQPYSALWPTAERSVLVEIDQAYANCRNRIPQLVPNQKE